MAIEEVIDRAVQLRQTIEIEYCTRGGSVFTCEISDVIYSHYYGGGYIQAYCQDLGEERTFKISRIRKVNGHSFSRIYWNQIGDRFIRILE
ncbi:MAG: WYL domain-containing protein [Prevotella sp.]|nr:WYL domain-containing protein [Prevotella sp.]